MIRRTKKSPDLRGLRVGAARGGASGVLSKLVHRVNSMDAWHVYHLVSDFR